MKNFIVYWRTTIKGSSSRGGYSIIFANDKRAARKKLRDSTVLHYGEKLVITNVEAV